MDLAATSLGIIRLIRPYKVYVRAIGETSTQTHRTNF